MVHCILGIFIQFPLQFHDIPDPKQSRELLKPGKIWEYYKLLNRKRRLTKTILPGENTVQACIEETTGIFHLLILKFKTSLINVSNFKNVFTESRSTEERLWKYGILSINLFALYSISYFILPLLSDDNGLVNRINLKSCD